MKEERKQCEHRHPENGNCLPNGGFCPAVRDEFCLKLQEIKAKESKEDDLDYQKAVEDTDYCERHEPTYNSDDGSM